MRTRTSLLPALAASAVAGAVALVTAGPVYADVTSVGGGAYGEFVSVHSLASVSSGPTPSVALPAGGGGTFAASVASVRAGTLLSTGLINVSTRGDTAVGHYRTATSSSSVANVNVGAGLVRASAVTSTCSSNGTGSTGSSTILGSNLGVSASPGPNTTVNIPGGSVTFNEQLRTNVPGSTTSITVNAIHVRLTGGALGTGDVIIGQSRCQANGPDVLRPVSGSGGSGGSGSGSGSGTGSSGSTGTSGSLGASGSTGTSGSLGASGTGTNGASPSSAGGVNAAAPATALPGTATFTG